MSNELGRFRIKAGGCHEVIAKRGELQPPFVKGALAAHAGKPEENPYRRQNYRRAWDLAYRGVKDGTVTVEKVEEEPK